jgi:hypothetical protein
MSDTEQWKPVTGYPGYQVSNMGRVASLTRYIQRGDTIVKRQGRTLKPQVNYTTPRVALYTEGKPRFRQIRDLVAAEFLPEPPQIPGSYTSTLTCITVRRTILPGNP